MPARGRMPVRVLIVSVGSIIERDCRSQARDEPEAICEARRESGVQRPFLRAAAAASNSRSSECKARGMVDTVLSGPEQQIAS